MRAATSIRIPATGKPYVDIRKQWDRLIAIASEMLGYPLVNEKADFFTFRHTGASNIAQTARNKDERVRVVNMMGDTNMQTVARYYLNHQYAPGDEVIAKLGPTAGCSFRRGATRTVERN